MRRTATLLVELIGIGLVLNLLANEVAPYVAGRWLLVAGLLGGLIVARLWLEGTPRLPVSFQDRLLALRRNRFVKLGGALLLFWVISAGYLLPALRALWIAPPPLCLPAQPCLLIAPLWPADNALAQSLSEEVRGAVRDAVSGGGIAPTIHTEIPPFTSGDEASAFAQQAGALLIVWGKVAATEPPQIEIYYTLSDLLGIGESSVVRPYRADPLDYDPVAQTLRCRTPCTLIESRQQALERMAVVGHTAAGLLRYVGGQPELASREFAAALRCAGEAVDSVFFADFRPACAADMPSATLSGTGLLRYYLGKSLTFQGDYARAEAQLQQANPDDSATQIALGVLYAEWIGEGAPLSVASFERAKALAAAQTMLGDPAFKATAHYHWALAAELLSKVEEAHQHYAAAVTRFGADGPGGLCCADWARAHGACAGAASRGHGNIRASGATCARRALGRS